MFSCPTRRTHFLQHFRIGTTNPGVWSSALLSSSCSQSEDILASTEALARASFPASLGSIGPVVDASGPCLYPNHLDLGASRLPISDVIHLPPLAHIPTLSFFGSTSYTYIDTHSRTTRHHLRPRLIPTSCADLLPPTSPKPASWPITRRRQSRPWGTGLSNRPSVCSIKAGWLGWTMTAGHGILPQVTQASKARCCHHRAPIQW